MVQCGSLAFFLPINTGTTVIKHTGIISLLFTQKYTVSLIYLLLYLSITPHLMNEKSLFVRKIYTKTALDHICTNFYIFFHRLHFTNIFNLLGVPYFFRNIETLFFFMV